LRRQGQRATAAARSLDVKPEKESVERRVVSGARGYEAQFAEPAVWQCPPGAGQPARFRDASGWVVGRRDDAVRDRVPVDAPQRGQKVLGGAASPS
jgi:hypothetical protein